MAPWEQDFDVYLGELDGGAASFVVDLAARDHAPLASHPLLLTLVVPMRHARPDGLGTQACGTVFALRFSAKSAFESSCETAAPRLRLATHCSSSWPCICSGLPSVFFRQWTLSTAL